MIIVLLVHKSCPTLFDPMDCSLPVSSVLVISAGILERVAIPSPRDLPDPGIEPRSLSMEILYDCAAYIGR